MSFQSIRRSANPLSLSRNPGIDDCRNLFEVFRVSCRQHGMMHEHNARDHRVANLYSPASPFARCHQTCGHPRSRNVERKNALVDCVQESFERRSKLQPFLARLHDLQPATVPVLFARQTCLRHCLAIHVGQVSLQFSRNTFVKQQPHRNSLSTSDLACSSAWTAASRVTVGKSSKNSFKVCPPSI